MFDEPRSKKDTMVNVTMDDDSGVESFLSQEKKQA